MMLGICAKIAKDYDASIKILKKALQYAWKINDGDKEIMIYDYIGMSYFYMGDIKNAEIYHVRYVEGSSESK